MKINDIGKPITAKSLNESLAAKFGKKIDLQRFTMEQLEDSRNKLRTKLKAVETTESFDSVHNETYQKTKMYLDVLNAEISERGGFDNYTNESVINEGSEDQAELVMAAKQMVDRLTGWMEDTAEMQTETMLELADSIRDEMGSEASEQFVNSVKPSLESLYAAMEVTRKSLTSGVGLLTGEGSPEETLGTDPNAEAMPGDELSADPAMDPAAGGTDDIDAELNGEMGAEAPPMDEPAGRPQRESYDSRRLGMILSKKK